MNTTLETKPDSLSRVVVYPGGAACPGCGRSLTVYGYGDAGQHRVTACRNKECERRNIAQTVEVPA